MVLEASDFYEQTAQDGFSENQNGAAQPRIALDSPDLPQPIPIIGTAFFPISLRRARFERDAKLTQSLLGRPLTYDENAAIAFWVSKEIRWISYSFPVGLTGAGLRVYATRESWRFPFWKPSPTFDPNILRIPGLGELGTFRGAMARVTWLNMRMCSYSAAGVVLSLLVIGPTAAFFASIGRMKDARLSDFVQSIQTRAMEAARRRQNQKIDPYNQGKTPAPDLWKNHRGAIGARDEAEDTSPTTGQGMSDDGYIDFDQAESQPIDSRAPAVPPDTRKYSQIAQHRQSQQPDPNTSSDTGFLDDTYDDASPSARPPSSRTAIPPSQAPSPEGGSAWDRIRQNAGGSSSFPDNAPAEQRNPKSLNDDQYGQDATFSKSDEERQLARGEAQQDFDARLERERQGEDFSSPGNRGRRW